MTQQKPTGDAADRPAGGEVTTPAEQSFARRALIAVAVALLAAAAALLLWYSMHVLLLAFAAVLVGVLLRGASVWVAGRFRIRTGPALGIVVLALVGFFLLLGVFTAPVLVREAERLADRLPESVRKAEDNLSQYSWGRRIFGHAPRADTALASPASPATQPASTQPTLIARAVEATTRPAVVQSATRLANRILQALVAAFVVLVVGIYVAAQPELYINGLLRLAPHAGRPRLREVLDRVGHTLRWWMIGQLVPMAVIGTLTAIGLKLLGVEMWLILGLLAALFNFIPNFGPLVSGVPAFLLALAHSPGRAGAVVVLYLVLQNLEGYVLTPLVQRKAVHLPPALTILVQVLLGFLLGALGVVLAAPLTAAAVVAVKMLYVEDVLGDETEVSKEGDV
jgi:predicted PurR-regulated permease PerM